MREGVVAGMDSGLTTSALLDDEKLASLFTMIRAPGKREQLICAFESSGSEHVEKLKLAVAQNDREAFFKRLHSLKGSAGTMALCGLVAICSLREDDEHPLTVSQMSTCAKVVEEVYQHSCSLLRDYQKSSVL
ncbi:Hpt domain-containing protein [Mariprofundus sp. NF]|nr:Hpt domain-containing protein [Mariprofundus sp. NF]